MDRADPAQPELLPGQGNPAADRDLVRRKKRLGPEPRVVADPDVGELDGRGQEPELDLPESHGPSERCGDPRLRDPLYPLLTPFRVPDSVAREHQEDDDDREEPQRRK